MPSFFPPYPPINNGEVTNAKLANMAAHTAKVRKTNSTGAPEDATMTELTALLNPATTSLQGVLTAAEKTALDALSSAWAIEQRLFIESLDQTFTGWKAFSPSSGSTTSASDASAEGGATHSENNVTRVAASVFQTPTAKHWAFASQVRWGTAPTVGQYAFAGMFDSNTSVINGVTFGTKFNIDATHFVLMVGDYTESGAHTDVVSTMLADTNWHDMVMHFDGTTIRVYVDQALVASTATLTNLLNQKKGTGVTENTNARCYHSQTLIGYVGP